MPLQFFSQSVNLLRLYLDLSQITESPSTIVPDLSNIDSSTRKGKEKVEDIKVNTKMKKGMGEYKF